MKTGRERRERSWLWVLAAALLLALAGCAADDGDDGARGPKGDPGDPGIQGPPGPPGDQVVSLTTASDAELARVTPQIGDFQVTIASPPVVTFSFKTADGRRLTGLDDLREEYSRVIRFTLAKLVPGSDGDADAWVQYAYEYGGTLVDNGDGTYTYTFATDVAEVEGVTYEPSRTHRLAGQFGDGDLAIEPLNFVYDFVPAGGELPLTKDIATTDSCNECHTKLTFHGRRFLVEYCVTCHNPGLADGEGDMAFMTHKIHAAGSFDVLDDAIDYSHVTYPQDLANCRKCHSGQDGDQWLAQPTMNACGSCHDGLDFAAHFGGQADNSLCSGCHDQAGIAEAHLTPNATPNNPNLLAGQREILYELLSVEVDAADELTVGFRITSDSQPLDLTNLPADLAGPDRWPGFLLAWAESQDGIDAPADFNNLGQTQGQPVSIGLDALQDGSAGTLACADGTCTATIPNAFPVGAGLRTVGLQGYFQQDLDEDGDSDVSLHTPSVVMAVAGEERREVVDSAKCFACHEWFEGHGGNRVIGDQHGVAICTVCHVPNITSSGRTMDLNYAEDTQNLKDMIHGIHAAAVRENPYEHVRIFRGSARFYDWSHVTFPSDDGVANCTLCHLDGTFELPLADGMLMTTVRTTGVADGMDAIPGDVSDALDSVPNATDWVNTPMASTCFYCHDSRQAALHMEQNGAWLSYADPAMGWISNRSDAMLEESCAVCHGPGGMADLETVHDLD